MKTVFISKLKPFLDAIADKMEIYIPKKNGEHYVYDRYDPSAKKPIEFNNIRACTPVKEFLLPACEFAAVFPKPDAPEKPKPFAVFGLKDCDLRSIKILDMVFTDEDFRDQLYMNRRENMFIISTDCTESGPSCFCNLFDRQGFSRNGFDLNVSKIKEGFIIEAGSKKGDDFIREHSGIFADITADLLAERDKNRSQVQKQLEQNNDNLKFNMNLREIMENSQDSDVFDLEAKNCIECQACTRVCPTCHCFYLYDTKQKDYFAKMKMWDSCMRSAYAAVAGGANPRKVLGDRIKHRLMHKFVYFLDRYGINMCVGCGRCIDADAGGIDLRQILKKLNEEFKSEDRKKSKVVK
jgi:ferredoxin